MFRNRVLAVSLVTAVAIVAAFAGASRATAPPIGPLPSGPTSTIQTQKGQLVAIALPHRAGGRSWRQAGTVNAHVLVEAGEADVGANVVIVFKATGTGTASVTFALTRGERAQVFEARRFTVRVS